MPIDCQQYTETNEARLQVNSEPGDGSQGAIHLGDQRDSDHTRDDQGETAANAG
jgi:hypothetical protein